MWWGQVWRLDICYTRNATHIHGFPCVCSSPTPSMRAKVRALTSGEGDIGCADRSIGSAGDNRPGVWSFIVGGHTAYVHSSSHLCSFFPSMSANCPLGPCTLLALKGPHGSSVMPTV
ncbi:hypothetical protein EGM_18728 [Macaca fascicularis]|uniref:Uncharacterized protein n=1 Tax=Macaca fascicularis TaxID=9541 RepID=G7Q2L8_MACFA|nr:hypothetical protein EGM_18728 [Macaca fascicularis]